jgi:hypothetical protein
VTGHGADVCAVGGIEGKGVVGGVFGHGEVIHGAAS